MTTISKSVVSGGDDGVTNFNASNYSTGIAAIQIGDFSLSGTNIAESSMRFTGLNIPPDALISEAFITFIPISAGLGTPVTKFRGENQDNPGQISNFADYIGRARTAASVPFSPGPWVNGVPEQSPDLTPIIREIVGRPGWVLGNAIQIFWEDVASGNPSAANQREAQSFEVSGGFSPTLTVTFDGASGAITTPGFFFS